MRGTNMHNDFKVGNSVYLLEPYKGYRSGTLISFCFPYWTVKLESGLELQLYEDEFELIE